MGHRRARDTLAWKLGLVKGTPSNLSQAMGEWLNQFAWDWFLTVTFREDVSDYYARWAVEHTLRWLERRLRGPVGAFWAIEKHKYRGGGNPAALTPHFHALVTNVAPLSRRDTWRYLFGKFGRSRIEPVIKGKGATYYVGKYVGKEALEQGDWGIWRPEIFTYVEKGTNVTVVPTLDAAIIGEEKKEGKERCQ